MTTETLCSYEECDKDARTKGMCRTHYQREWANTTKTPETLARQAERQREYTERLRQNGSLPVKTRKTNLWVMFRLTPEQYDTMLLQQDFSCAICRRHMSEFEKNLSVDHDHSCCPGARSCGECVRGLLCSNCNTGIGMLQDRADVLESATEYLRSWEV